ncbi:NAD(P)H-dependent FMN reductase/ketosteroid isomerase-like protein [Sphingomonas sp. UYAg733]
MSTTRVGVIVGSLRQASYSRRLARALIDRAPADWACTIIEIADLPLYNQDLEIEAPRQWTRFREEIGGCDAMLFVTPEYNRSIPGALKNATDIGSRPTSENKFEGLPAAIVTVTPFSGGGAAANHALRQSFVFLNLAVMQQPEAYISHVDDLVDDQGRVSNEEGDKLLRRFMAGFSRWVERVGFGRAQPLDQFLSLRKAAFEAYIKGDAAPLVRMETAAPATFFPANGGLVEGAEAITQVLRNGAEVFWPGCEGNIEVAGSGSSGGLAWWSCIHRMTGNPTGETPPSLKALRITEVFREEHDGWKVVHRHEDLAGPMT